MATATRTAVRLPTPAPLPEYLDLTRMIARRARTITGLYGLAVMVVADPFGAPARFVPASREVHIHKSVVEHIDLRSIRSVQELNAKHPEVMGVVLHELFHAMHSMSAEDMLRFQKEHGARLYKAVALLDEGRIESLGYPNLTGIEKEALRAMVPEFVLSDVDPDEEPDEVVKSIKQGVRLVGLLAARAEAEVLDMDNPRCIAVWSGTVSAMGEWFSPFFDIAQKFSKITYTSRSEQQEMAALAEEWIALEDALLAEQKEREDERKKREKGESTDDGDGESEEDGDGDEEGEDEGDGKGKGDEEGDEEGDGSKGAGDEDGDEDGESEDSAPDQANEDGDEQSPSLGEYNASSGDAEDDAVDVEAIRRIVREELPHAAQEQREASGKRLTQAAWDMERTVVADHDERRRKNQEAMARWR